MPVRFFGPIGSTTGYGNAVMNFARAFSQSSISTRFMFGKTSQKFLKELNNYNGPCKTDFYLHCPPYHKHQSLATYKIAYFYWEADQLPKHWMQTIHKVDELWVPCNLVKSACIRAKFKGPIKVIPTPCEDWHTEEKVSVPSSFSEDFIISDDVYKFYSIFQWHNRKGFNTLLNAYYKTFTEQDNVILILKVNPLNIGAYRQEAIKPNILEIKRRLNLTYYPPVYLSMDVVNTDMIKALHNYGDCYVSPHHGEGWGMPIHDAMRLGKQLIVTQYGGVTEFLDKNSAHIIKHTVGPVSGMEWSQLYGSYQNWAHPSVNHLSTLFRDVYENHKAYQSYGLRAKEIAEEMTVEKVSKIISKELAGR